MLVFHFKGALIAVNILSQIQNFENVGHGLDDKLTYLLSKYVFIY